MKQFIFIALLLPGVVHGMVKRDAATRDREEALVHYKQVLTGGRYVYGNHVQIHLDAKRRVSGILKACQACEITESEEATRLQVAQHMVEWVQVLHGLTDLILKQGGDIDPESQNTLKAQLSSSKVSLESWIALLKSEKIIDLTTIHRVMLKKRDQAENLKREASSAQERFERSAELSTKLPLVPALAVLCVELPKLTDGA